MNQFFGKYEDQQQEETAAKQGSQKIVRADSADRGNNELL